MEDFKNIDTNRILMMKEETFLLFLDHFYEKVKSEKSDKPEFVNEAMALTILGLRSKTSLWQLRRNGKIAFSKMGKIILYRRSSLEKHILDNEHRTI